MALQFLRVLLLGVVAAVAHDVPITWSGRSTSLGCVVPAAELLQPRRPPLPLEAEDNASTSLYLWRKDDEEISSKRISASGALEVSRRRDNEGVYQCLVRHHGGLVLGYPVHLKFASMEKQFSVQPSNVSVAAGQPALLTCSIGSEPPATVNWLRGDQPLPANDRYHVLQSQLLITNVTTEDAGTYRCVATNPYVNKTRWSPPGRLHVESSSQQPASLMPVSAPSDITAPRRARLQLPCPVLGWPRPRLIWKVTPPDGREAELDSVDEVLVIHSLQPDLEGTYTCHVQGNRHLKKTFRVTMSEPPVITIPPTSKERLRASTVRFNCTAVGTPAPDITWYKDGQLLSIAGRINLRKSTDGQRTELVISGVTSDDAGVYQCFAANSVSVVSAWATLNVTGADAAAPTAVRCWPLDATRLNVSWQPPAQGEVVAYTVHRAPIEDKAGNSLPGHPIIDTWERVSVDEPLVPYRFQVKAYSKLSPVIKNAVSDFSVAAVCQGQGVPFRLVKLDEESVLVTWKQFAEKYPGVVQWILQTRVEGSDRIHNHTLDGSVHNYTLTLDGSGRATLVRLLGSRSWRWLAQDLAQLAWTSTAAAATSLDDGEEEVTVVPHDLQVGALGPREALVTWRCDQHQRYQYTLCAHRQGRDHCQDSWVPAARLSGLSPGSSYWLRVRARLPSGRAGPYSAPLLLTTPQDRPSRFTDLSASFVNFTTLKVSWNGAPARYTVHYSAKLKLPIELWASVETTNNSVLIPGIDSSEPTYLMVTGYDPEEHSRVETVPPITKEPNVKYEYTSAGVRVWWEGEEEGQGQEVLTARYSQNMTQPLDQWATALVTGNSIELVDLDPALPTFVMLTGSKRGPFNLIISPSRFADLSASFVNFTTLKVSWNGAPARYTVHYSAKLKLPIELWTSVETTNNSVLIPGIDSSEPTYLMVTGYDPEEHSRVETVPPITKEPNVKYEYTSAGVRVWWEGEGEEVLTARYSQNITQPIDQWATAPVTGNSIELVDLDPALPTFVMLTGSKRGPSRALTIEPRPADNSALYIGVGVSLGACAACGLALAGYCGWRRYKARVARSRRRNAASNEENPEEESEMKSVSGRALANGGAGRARQPLLNGARGERGERGARGGSHAAHAQPGKHATHSKTPNGKVKKGRHYEAVFDVSRAGTHDDSAASCTLLDTSREPRDTRDVRDSRERERPRPADDSFAKLPDDNMNSELTRSIFQLDNSKIQPTLQPNG